MRGNFIAIALALAIAACETTDASVEPGAKTAAKPSADAAQAEVSAPAAALPRNAEQKITLAGDLTREDFQTYREIPFTVPRGVTRLTVDFAYDKTNNTVVDLGLRDPAGQRGWSGGNKSSFTITQSSATPSYLPGRIQPGEWRLVLGVPNIRPSSTAHYEAIVTLSSAPVERVSLPSGFDRVLSRQAGWRRGDFHMHTGHSDGSCDDGTGKRGPCPIERTIVAGRAALLDFIAITDHNTLSHRDPMHALQSAFPSMLLIPGEEITTFWGHANAIGVKEPLEFQLGSQRLPDVGKLLDAVDAQAAILSINHPRLPSGEVCMGCGWSAPDTPFSRVAAIEVINGATLRTGNVEGAASGIPFWEAQLDEGLHITAIGGSDNHDPADRTGARQSPVGTPATIVWAKDLSVKGILDGVKSGRVFIDLANSPRGVLDLEGRAGAQIVPMGGTLELGPAQQAHVYIKLSGVTEAQASYVSRGLLTITPSDGPGSGTDITVQLSPGAATGWIRAEVRNSSGKLVMIGNPIYVRAKP